MKHVNGQVEVWHEDVVLPTYEVGTADKNPIFLEKRVYQGSSGKVYPYPVIDKIYDEKKDKTYRAVFLENDYLRLMILPELGGRIQRAYDKTNGYDFVYYNEVIKPALVGLLGPWISGGIEFNWPQHHRPSTYLPVDHAVLANADGSKTVQVNETDKINGTKAVAGFTLYPDRAYLEIKGQLYNPTELPQTFLWWANPAVAVNDNTQSIFPPDVHAVMDHGKRGVSRFPIATGTYYKHDYSAGVDISRYKNIPVPTSYMAYRSDYDFVGGYDYGVDAGILHIADHHISPGKKQWTWGSGDFGKAWDRNLTDKNGPYIELMTGVYTDNQPDFTWLKPFEEKSFAQYFMPYKKVANVKNASTEVLLNLEKTGDAAKLCVYATAVYEDANVTLRSGDSVLFETVMKLSPNDILTETVPAPGTREEDLTLSVCDQTGRLILSYRPAPKKIEKIPEAAQPAKDPKDLNSLEELYLTGLHIEQYRHATFEPDPYYIEGLKRDPGESRLNNAYGMLLFRRGLFLESEPYFRKAVERLMWKNPNPYDSEAFYNLGLSLLYQSRFNEAFDSFYKATWTSGQQEMSFYFLAGIAAHEGHWEEALALVGRSLVKNSHNIKARGLRAVILRRLGRKQEAEQYLTENISVDQFDYLSRLELARDDSSCLEETLTLIRDEPATFISVAIDYASWGLYTQAIETLHLTSSKFPLLAYYEAYCHGLNGDKEASKRSLADAAARDSRYCFPNRLMDIKVLEYAIQENQSDAKAPYYLGNLLYDKKQYARARSLWEASVGIDANFPTAWRNLSLAYYNKDRDPGKSQTALEKAFALDQDDARVFSELDQLYKKRGVAPAERIVFFDAHPDLFARRDDLVVEYVTLLNLLGRHEEAYRRVMSHRFHPWEGGEGKVTSQYTLALVELARKALAEREAEKAEELLLKALSFPENLGEGWLEGANENNVHYYLGCAQEALGDSEAARQSWARASTGEQEPVGAMFYNDQPPDMIFYQGLALQKLGLPEQAQGRFHKLVDYGETHIFDTMRIDYFAVSLPDLQLFDEDLDLRNKGHCQYLIALGSYGLGDRQRAIAACEKTLEVDLAHIGATLMRKNLVLDK
ncbi:hypothetical protein NKR23_g11964 [Pleurostoma richardsiae]|uniref:DUF5107 domain-containing protein n=1 Tax=Pleurostoma richardsiae TaxID=41990 RepID=A0AA38R991_9PEZI|nr:hypothetical protein NKR23_g11964 [Pleurostoma richardsiae]